MQHNGWDHGLKVTDDGAGLVGHGGGVLLRKLADQCGLTAALDGALARTFSQLSRGVVVVPSNHLQRGPARMGADRDGGALGRA
jgi:hypothetical protein